MLLTSPMRGQGSNTHCVCVCVCVTTLASAMNTLKAKVSYQQKALNVGNKIDIRIELKILSLKVMTVISLIAGNQRQQVTSVVRRRLLVGYVL